MVNIDKHTGTTISESDIREFMKEVNDPEVPVISVIDLGIIRDITVTNNGGSEPRVSITITPTYSGCPAMDVITINIRMKMLEKGFRNVEIKTTLSPAWTTDWMSDEGKRKLKEFGIAPPNPSQSVCNTGNFHEQEAVQCPQCNSYSTRMISRFGSTACKAFYQCNECAEPFDYFKCH